MEGLHANQILVYISEVKFHTQVQIHRFFIFFLKFGINQNFIDPNIHSIYISIMHRYKLMNN